MIEQGWLIEGVNTRDGTAMYWTGLSIGNDWNAFSSNSLDGIRFSRKIDAEKTIHALFRYSKVFAVSHGWEVEG